MGFVFGTLCLVGLGMLLLGGRRRRWHRHHGHPGHGGRGGCGHRRHRHHPHRRTEDRDDATDERTDGRERSADDFVRVAKRGLNLREEQVGFVDAALEDARKAIDDFAADLRETRDDLASAVTGDIVDDARLAAVFESHDDAVRQVRRDVVEAVKKVHAALDPDQRSKLAHLFEHTTPWV